MTTYDDSLEHLADEMARLDLIIRSRLLKQKNSRPPGPLDQFKGLVISEDEVSGLLEDMAVRPFEQSDAGSTNPEELALATALGQSTSQIVKRRAASLSEGVYLSLPHLSELFGLTAFEEGCLLVCLGPELDRRYEKLYAYLQDDVTQKKPSVDLAMNLLLGTPAERLAARSSFEPQAPLMKYRLLRMTDDAPGGGPLISRHLKLDDRIVNFLIHNNQIDARLEPMARLAHPEADRDHTLMAEDAHRQIQDFVRAQSNDAHPFWDNIVCHFYGPYGSGKRALGEAISADIRFHILAIDAGKMLDGPLPYEEAVWLLGREALLQPALLCLENFDRLLADDPGGQARLQVLLEVAQSCSWVTFLFGSQPWRPRGLPDRLAFIDRHFPPPDDCARKRHWEAVSSRGYMLEGGMDLGALASKFRLTHGQIQDALAAAQTLVWLRSPDGGQISAADLDAACRAQSSQTLSGMARKIEPIYTWGEIVLPDDVLTQLREICQRIIHRHRVLGEWGFAGKLSLGKGLTALFAGPSGTGKTMATEILARELGFDLYKIDLSGVVSKYVGETEKNLDRVFAAACDANAILYFDEADALFGKRSEVRDSHDRYANIEISYLLQKMEEYEGLAILATNLRANLDEAFTRRLAFTIQFPFPDEMSRLRIWQGIWPERIRLAADVDLDFLARQFKLSGGNIKNIARAAAFLAAEDEGQVTMAHLLRATRREYQKLGKLLGADQLGPYAFEEVA